MTKKRLFIIGTFALIIVVISVLAYAQTAGMYSVQRARDVAGGAPMGSMAPMDISPEQLQMFNQGNMLMMNQQEEGPTPEVKMITVLEGDRVISAVSGEVLQQPERKQVPDTQKNQYYDDGTHGDEVAGDGIYSNVVERKDVISKDEYIQRIRLEALINKIVNDKAVDFYREYAAAESPNPVMPTVSYWKNKKTSFVEEYRERVLRPYKNEKGDYYEVYEAPKPKVNPLLLMQQQNMMMNNMQGGNMMMPGAMGGASADPTMQGMNMGVGGSSYFGERNRMN